MSNLLSRYADAIFWMARQVERVDDLARILDINESFSRDSHGAQNWLSVLRLYADEERFFERHHALIAETALYFYVLDPEHPGSILSTLHAARENARQLRPLISTEMWQQLNVFYAELKAIEQSELTEQTLNRICAFIKQSCQTHVGITEATFYRDEGWHFLRLGTLIERADQTTRLLDVKYELLLPSIYDVGSPLDVGQWGALLRSVAAFHAFRRIHPSGMTSATVAGFLLLNERFPRSVAACIFEASRILDQLRRDYGLGSGGVAADHLRELEGWIARNTIQSVISYGLHETLDWIQRELIIVTEGLAEAFFGYAPRES